MPDIKFLNVKDTTYQFYDEYANNKYYAIEAEYAYLGEIYNNYKDIYEDLAYRISQIVIPGSNKNYLGIERVGSTPVVLKWPKRISRYSPMYRQTLYYSYNKITWNRMLSDEENTITLNDSNPKVYFKSPISTFFSELTNHGNLVFIDDKASGYSSKGTFKISGNIMSITYGDNFESKTSLTDKNLSHLFENTNVTDISNLQLPATTLSGSCYESMFQGCTSLTNVPSNLLPATTLSGDCYKSMFQGCTSLVTGPSLIANNLDVCCYESMFQGCTSLMGLYENTLSASTLQNKCYKSMFQGCSSMVIAPTISATQIAQSSMAYMFKDCSNLRTIVYSGIWERNYSPSYNPNTDPAFPYSIDHGYHGSYGPFYYWVENVWSTGEFINYNNLPFRKISDVGYAYDGIPINFTNVTSPNT